MKTNLLVLYVLLIFGTGLSAQNFGPDTKISLITIGPGHDLYSKFGHSAIRLSDPSQGLDLSYNYGTFDFDAPNFYGKFVRGKLDYILSVDKTFPLLRYYQRTGREVVEQDLLLSPEEVQEVAAFLIENYKPENRTYKYDFFYDNCATRLRDIIELSTESRLSYKITENSDRVYRDLLIEKLESVPLVLLGINLILGPNTDQPADFRGAMFLPAYLMDNLDAFAKDVQGKSIVGPKKLVFPERLEFSEASFYRQPAFYALLLLVLSFVLHRSGKLPMLQKGLTIGLFSLSGVSGLLFLFMWFFTNHQTTYMNLNLFWANPLSFIFLMNWKGKQLKFPILLNIQKALLLMGLLVLVALPILQELTGRAFLGSLPLPKHFPYQLFLFAIMAMLWIQYAKFTTERERFR